MKNDAVARCIEKNEELSRIIRGHKAEVTRMLLTEYDEAAIAKQLKLPIEQVRKVLEEL